MRILKYKCSNKLKFKYGFKRVAFRSPLPYNKVMSRVIIEDSLLLNDSNSQPCDDSVLDIDQLLKPLSVSQQLVEDELNSKDEKIKEELSTQQEQIKTDHEDVVNNHKIFPTLLRKRPPGLVVFIYEQPLIFSHALVVVL